MFLTFHCQHIVLLLLLLISFLTQARAECNACNALTNIACVSENQFQLCTNGEPVGTILECTGNNKCTISGRCEAADATALLSCSDCDICDATKTFACTGTRTFALCLGEDDKSQITGSCEPNLVCNINNQYICGTADEGFPSTCSFQDDPPTTTEAPTTTTPSPNTNPQEFCKILNKEGRFPVGTNPDTTCRQYIHCIQSNGAWYGPIYYCPGGTYFNDARKSCTTTVPGRCSSRVQRLALFNLELY